VSKSLEKQLIDRHDLSGKKFGRWTVISYIGAGVYETQCDCGHMGTKKTTELTHMRSIQCARCRRKELIGLRDSSKESGNDELVRSKWSNSIYSIRKEDLDE
jgi:hypothetical protein